MAWDIISSVTEKVEDTNPRVWRDAAEVDVHNGLSRDAVEKIYKAKNYYGEPNITDKRADSFLESCVPIIIKLAKRLSNNGNYEKSTELIYDILGRSSSELAKYKKNIAICKLLSRNYLKLGSYDYFVWYRILCISFVLKQFPIFLIYSIFIVNFIAIILIYFARIYMPNNFIFDLVDPLLAVFAGNYTQKPSLFKWVDFLLSIKNFNFVHFLSWILTLLVSPITAIFIFFRYVYDWNNWWFRLSISVLFMWSVGIIFTWLLL